jgi:hypothetical protein
VKTLLLLFVAHFAVAPARAQECPVNGIEKPGFTHSSADSIYWTDAATDFGRTVYDGWDLVRGTLRIHHWGGLGTSTVHATDLFDVTGVAPGTNVVVGLWLQAGGWAATSGCGGTGCAGVLTATITTPEQTVSDYGVGATFGGVVSLGCQVYTALTLTAGTPVPVTFALEGKRSPGGSHSVDGTGTYTFLDVPEGVTVVSCQRYLDPSVPARPQTWGRLKALYR